MNITSVQQLTTLIMVQAMGPTAIQGAKVYAAATILGVGFLPVGVAGMLLGKDDSSKEFGVSFDKAFDATLAVFKKTGEVKEEARGNGVIKAKVDGTDITVRIDKANEHLVLIKVSARKLMMPRPEVAGGILYQIEQVLK